MHVLTCGTCRSILSRTALVSDLSSKGVVNLVSDEVRQIYSLLEADFTPLELCQRLAPLLTQLETVTKSMSGRRLQILAASRCHYDCRPTFLSALYSVPLRPCRHSVFCFRQLPDSVHAPLRPCQQWMLTTETSRRVSWFYGRRQY